MSKASTNWPPPSTSTRSTPSVCAAHIPGPDDLAPDVIVVVDLTLQHENVHSGGRESDREGATRDSAADDGNVVGLHARILSCGRGSRKADEPSVAGHLERRHRLERCA